MHDLGDDLTHPAPDGGHAPDGSGCAAERWKHDGARVIPQCLTPRTA
ncbi:hypothetical protein [Methylobacterium planeticum]|nr:hypothetical protein [Methylobacterium planeticum]